MKPTEPYDQQPRGKCGRAWPCRQGHLQRAGWTVKRCEAHCGSALHRQAAVRHWHTPWLAHRWNARRFRHALPPLWPPQATATAYFKRFYVHRSCLEHDPARIMPTCIYLAAKVGARLTVRLLCTRSCMFASAAAASPGAAPLAALGWCLPFCGKELVGQHMSVGAPSEGRVASSSLIVPYAPLCRWRRPT